MPTEKSRESNLRRKLDRRGYFLHRNPARNPNAPGYGLYMIVEHERRIPASHGSVLSPYALDLNDVEQWVRDHDAGAVAA